MLDKIFMTATEISPKLKRWLWRRWYQYLAGYRAEFWLFMNYGYAPLDDSSPMLELAEEEEQDRFCIQLYNHVAGRVDLKDVKVLEVGSGRGGGSSFIKRYLAPKTMTGVDFSSKAVDFSNRIHDVEGLTFQQGDAEKLQFDDNSFDAIVNVESSHCYGSVPRFLAQVQRILRPGGHFLFADFRPSEQIDELTSQLQESGLSILEEENISPNVVRALELDSERKRELVKLNFGRVLSKSMQQCVGVKGSTIHQNFDTGVFIYKRFLLQKPTDGTESDDTQSESQPASGAANN